MTDMTQTHSQETALVAPQIKSAGADVNGAFDDFARAFHQFRETNDERLAKIETRMGGDVVTEEKLARIDAALDESRDRIERLQLERRRPPLAIESKTFDGKMGDDPLRQRHKAAFGGYMRGGESTGLRALEAKALSAGSGPDGGFLVPATVEGEILSRLARLSPIRSIASVQTISGGVLKKPFSVTGPATGWVGEVAPRPQTDTPNLAELTFPAMELYAMPAATQTLLDDAVFDVEAWLAGEVELAFASQEGTAFVTGDGVNKPRGFLTVPTIANNNWQWGSLGHVATGAAGAFPGASPTDTLVDLVYALRAGYRQNAVFVMNRRTQSVIRKFKDASGNYLWAPPAGLDQPATLMNFPVIEAEDMPDIAANSLSVAFGDFRRGYLVVDRAGVRVLRDPYSAKPYVLFYTTKRVGGGIQDFDAIKVLRFATA
jgi:HK97 family phage major capsid protein